MQACSSAASEGSHVADQPIGVDLSALRWPLTGIGNYELQLLIALLRTSSPPNLVGFDGWRWGPVSLQQLEHLSNLAETSAGRRARTSIVARLIRESTLIRRLVSGARRAAFEYWRPELMRAFHAFSYVPPGKSHVPTIPVVYDISFIRFPEAHPAARRWALRALGDWIARAPIVHTISNFSARELRQTFGVPESRIAVIYPGVNSRFLSADLSWNPASLRKFSLRPKGFFLSVSTLEPRKNLRTLISAYSQLPHKVREHFPLCIAGASGWGALQLPDVAEDLQRTGALRFLQYVSVTELRDLYMGCRATFYPSLYEGFGMPITEALACGARVVTSSAASMPEAGGPWARYASPDDVSAWREELLHAADSSTADIATIEGRRAFAAQFTWQKSAILVSEMYRRL